MGHLQSIYFLLFSGIFLATKVQGTWYDYGFAETSGKVSQDGTLLKKPDGTPLPNLPSGFERTTITLDSDGNLYTAYFLEIEKDVVDPVTGTLVKNPIHHLTWLKWNQDTWQEKTATLQVDNIKSPKVAVDSMGNAFLFYLNNGILEYALWSETNQTFDPTRTSIQTSEYVVDVHFDGLKQASHPQITYLDKGSIKACFIHPETESEEILEVTQGTSSALSIAIDDIGNPHILYHDLGEDLNRNGKLDEGEDINDDGELNEGTRNLKYATYDAALKDFFIYVLGSGHEAGSQNSITIDENGKIHVCYYDAKRLELSYANKDLTATQWEAPQTVDNNWINGGLNDIATDANGKVHISYLGYYGYNIKYATNKTGSWTNEIIHTTQEEDRYRATSIEGRRRWLHTS